MNNPSRVAFTLFGRDVYWYGVLMALGILIAVWLTLKEGKRKRLTEDDILDMCLVIIPSGVVGARLYYVIFEWASYASNPIRALYIWEGACHIRRGNRRASRYVHLFQSQEDTLSEACGLHSPRPCAGAGNRPLGKLFNQEAFGLPISNGELMWFPLRCI